MTTQTLRLIEIAARDVALGARRAAENAALAVPHDDASLERAADQVAEIEQWTYRYMRDLLHEWVPAFCEAAESGELAELAAAIERGERPFED